MTPGIEAFADDGVPLERQALLLGGAGERERVRTVIAMHGLGDTPQGLAAHFADVPVRARVVLLRAPVAFAQGFAWFPYRGLETTLDDVAAGAAVAYPRVLRAVESIRAELRIDEPVDVLGFSQGAVLTYSLAVRAPSLVGRGLAIAGALVDAPDAGSGRKPEITALHGADDPAAPVALGEASVARLRAAGHAAALVVRPASAHEITPPMREVVRAWLAGTLT